MPGAVRIGTSGFSFRDWKGAVYPHDLKDRDALPYYEDRLGFDCVEINASYYALFSTRTFEGLARKTRPGFLFSVKAFRGITHEPFDPRRPERPSLRQAADDRKRFLYSIRPLQEAGRLGAVLLQFPVFFHPSERSKDYLRECREDFRGLPLVVEFRNRGWMRPGTFPFLDETGLGFCAVDEPRLPRLMPFVAKVTAGLGYVRFHGRNEHWFNVPVSERYDYLYSADELKEFVPPIRRMERKAGAVFVFFNNCHAAYAPRNAATLKRLLAGKPAAVPPPPVPVG